MNARRLASRMRLGFLMFPLSFSLLLASGAGAQCEAWLQGPLDDGTLPTGADGTIYAAVSWDPDGAGPLPERLVVGGSFDSVGGVPANNVAYYDPNANQWFPFGIGIGAVVHDLVVFNGQVVAACSGDNNEGTFDDTVRRWNGTAWEGLSATNTGSVYELAVHSGRLYIGGSFVSQFTTGTQPAFNVAAYDPPTDKWVSMTGAGFGTFATSNTRVQALHSYNGSLYIGGYVNDQSGNIRTRIVVGDISAGWVALTDGTSSGAVYDITDFAGEVIIGGSFNELNGVVCRGTASWNGFDFAAIDLGVDDSGPAVGAVHSITVFEGLVIAGSFDSAGSWNCDNVARKAPGSSFWTSMGLGINDVIYDTVVYQNRLVAVGAFTAAPSPASRIAQWNGTSWNPVGGGNAAAVFSYANFNGRLVAGGSFQRSTFALGTANYIASWNGSTFAPFGTGMSAQVHAVEAFKYSGFNGSHELIAGGVFTSAGGVSALRIARWNERPNVAFPPPAWEAMGAGFNSNVNAIERGSSATYAGGIFTFSGATPVNRIARWNETTDLWEALGSGMNGAVYALKEFNGQLYAGGAFTTAGGVATGGLARWNGSAWSQVGGNFLGTVYALEVHDGQLYIGGSFPGLANGSNIARYNGSTYSNVGSGGTNAAVLSLYSTGTKLFMGGEFATAGGVTASRLAVWDGAVWAPVFGGADGAVRAIGKLASEVHVGGNFGLVGPASLTSPRWARYNETGLPWIGLHPFSKLAQLGSSVSFSSSVNGGLPGLIYQWMHNDIPLLDGVQPFGSIISGANSEVLTIDNVVFSSQGGYRLEVTNACGVITSSTAMLTFDAVDSPVFHPRVSSFDGIGANPSSGPTVLSFSLAQTARVEFTVHDLRGRRVRKLEVGSVSAGRHQTHWDARDQQGETVAAGVYFVRLELDGQPLTAKRVTIVR